MNIIVINAWPRKSLVQSEINKLYEELENEYGVFWEYFPQSFGDSRRELLDKYRAELAEIERHEKAHYCEKCNSKLIPGENYFTMRERHVCTKCEPFTANYAKNPRGGELIMKTEIYMNYPI